MDIHARLSREHPGVLATLDAAKEAGWITGDELSRQHRLMEKANEVEKIRGAASQEYIEPSRGDLKHVAAQRLIACARSGAKGVAILNAKKETAYMFADELIALHDACPDADITYIANLDNRGLPKVRADAQRIRDEMAKRGVPPELVGALDEYGANGDALGARIREDRAVVCAHRRRRRTRSPGVHERDRVFLGHERPPPGRAAPRDRAPARARRDRPPPEDAGRPGDRGERVWRGDRSLAR